MNKNFQYVECDPFGIMILGAKNSIQELPKSKIVELFNRHQLVICRDFETFSQKENFITYSNTFGNISLWPFGEVLELIEHQKPEDHIFDHNYVPLHWDGMYRPKVPQMQIFHCVHAPEAENGGRTTFSHSAMALENVPNEVRDLWSRASIMYQRQMEYYKSVTIAPIIDKHPFDGFSLIRYCEPPIEKDDLFINHPIYEFQGVPSNVELPIKQSLKEALYSPNNFYAHQWKNNDIVFADNFTLLHGREAFTSGTPRHLQRIHVLSDPVLNNPHLVDHS